MMAADVIADIGRSWRTAKPKLAPHLGDLVDPNLLGHVIIVDIAAFRQTAFQRSRCRGLTTLPAVELAFAEFDIAGAS
jgi:hypothetical protein